MIDKKKILIVSSEPELQGILHQNLTEGGYQLTSIEDCEEELKELVDGFLPDLIILDISMPWLDGIETCLRIRQWCQTPVIMLSTWDAKKDTVRSLDLSSDSYLTEPYNVQELMSQIEETICRN
ncbi:MAG: response regulator [Chloroflexi bacterium]|nr:response regulator [Chloroflexota bacterium]